MTLEMFHSLKKKKSPKETKTQNRMETVDEAIPLLSAKGTDALPGGSISFAARSSVEFFCYWRLVCSSSSPALSTSVPSE